MKPHDVRREARILGYLSHPNVGLVFLHSFFWCSSNASLTCFPPSRLPSLPDHSTPQRLLLSLRVYLHPLPPTSSSPIICSPQLSLLLTSPSSRPHDSRPSGSIGFCDGRFGVPQERYLRSACDESDLADRVGSGVPGEEGCSSSRFEASEHRRRTWRRGGSSIFLCSEAKEFFEPTIQR